MSLDITLLVQKPTPVFEGNITHNLTKMAQEAGLYLPLWRPEELGVTKAGSLVCLLAQGLATLHRTPETFIAMNPENGWGDYNGLVTLTKEYLLACCENPEAEIEISR